MCSIIGYWDFKKQSESYIEVIHDTIQYGGGTRRYSIFKEEKLKQLTNSNSFKLA